MTDKRVHSSRVREALTRIFGKRFSGEQDAVPPVVYLTLVEITVNNHSEDHSKTQIVSGEGNIVTMDTTLGNIQQSIGSLSKDAATADVGNALKQLLDAVQAEPTLPESKRKAAIKQIEKLSIEATKPREERESWVTGPLVNTVAGLCSGAGGLATLWPIIGPTLTAFFGG